MYKVGSIEPDGMLNGATTKLRNAQAASARSSRKRIARPAFWRPAADEVRAGPAHEPVLLSGRRTQAVKAGVAKGGAPTIRRFHGGQAVEIDRIPGCQPLDALFTAEPDRLSRLSFEVAGIYFDWSKTHLDAALLKAFAALSERQGFAAAREALFTGGIVNPSEGQAAEHVAERGSGAPDAVDLATARRQRMRALIDAIEAGAFGDVTGVLHIGIGGSVLGPALLVDALGRRRAGYKVRFLSNIDGEAFDAAVSDLDPATTLVVVASKTFTTAETLANMAAALRWLRRGGGRGSGRAADRRHRQPRSGGRGRDRRDPRAGVRAWGRRAIFAVELGRACRPRWRWAGTRSRNCSRAAAEMDRHFRFADGAENVPLVAAFADRLYVAQAQCQTRGVFAYDERLRLLPSYLQQLEMELNGKSVTRTGNRSIKQPRR